MKNESVVRDILVNNTIQLIAEGGFEKATTKAITYSDYTPHNFKLNEVYIYRLFGSKENLYEAAFDTLDKEFSFALNRCFTTTSVENKSIKEKLYNGFIRVWDFILRKEDRCRCYIRYYYSAYFQEYSLEKHNENFALVVNSFKMLFKPQADTKSIMHSVLTTLLDFAVRVFNGDLKNTDENKTYVFNVLLSAMMVFFKDEYKKELTL